MNLNQLLSIAIVILTMNFGFCQSGNNLFDPDTLHEIRFDFEQSNFWFLMTTFYNSSISPNTGAATNTPYLMGTMTFDGEIVDSVGLRHKGFSSYFFAMGDKKSFKVDLNEFVDGNHYDGIKKFNLSNGIGDPAMQRDFIAYDLMRKAGIRAPRTAYAKVFLNDTYWGVYVIIEQIDKTFLQSNFADGNGNLYKNVGWSELEYLGDNPTNYQASIALRTNKDDPDWSDYTEFVKVLNQTPQSQFKEEIEKVFNVDYYLKVLAIDVMTNNWDSYIEHGRNFYIYHEPSSDQFFWIPWDYNLSLGGDFINNNPIIQEIDDPASCQTITSGSSPYTAEDSTFLSVIDIQPTCCFGEWDFFCQDLYDHIDNVDQCNTIVNGSCPYPIDDVLMQQVTFFEPSCCDSDWGQICQDFYDDLEEFQNGGGFGLPSFPLNMSGSEKVLIRKILMVPEYRNRYFDYACKILDDNFVEDRINALVDKNAELISEAFEEDGNANFSYDEFLWDVSDGADTAAYTIPPIKKFMKDRVQVLEQELMDLGEQCNSSSFSLNWNDVVINEFVASNDSLSNITDQDGESDDWIELYNNTDIDQDLSNYFLSDNYDNSLKWSFPPGSTIKANDFLIVWADENGMEEGLHANFKLAKDGESIMLVHSDGTFVDSLSYGLQETNVPYARVPNGTGAFQSHYPTFNRSNDGPSSINEIDGLDFKLFPNPAREVLNVIFEKDYNSDKLRMSLTNIYGASIINSQVVNDRHIKLDIGGLPSGMYFVSLEKGNSKTVKKIIIE